MDTFKLADRGLNFMHNALLNLRRFQVNVPLSRKLMASSLCLGLLSTLPLAVSAQQPVAPLVSQAENAPADNAVQRQLQGQWQLNDATSGQVLTLIFTPDGKFFIVSPVIDDGSNNKTRVAFPLGYSIDPTAKPMHMDVKLPEENQTVLTIFELTPDGQLRLQIAGTNPGEPRPTAFNPEAALLQKVSEESSLPPDAQLVSDLETPPETQPSGEAEGKQIVGTMTRAQQAYYLEFERFATTIKELGIGIESETENYRYQLVPQDNQRERVMMTARAKRPELRSYTGVVFVVKSKDNELLTVGSICETDEPSLTPPAMPTIPSNADTKIQCPVGSHLLGSR